MSNNTNSNNGSVTINPSGGIILNTGASGNNSVTGNYQYTFPVQWISTHFNVDPIMNEPEEAKPSTDGCNCKKCKEHFAYAEEPADGQSFICWACKHGY